MTDIQARLAQLSPEKRALLAKKLLSKQSADKKESASTLPSVVPMPEDRFAPFPLMELQQAYWIGRSGAFEMGQVAGHSYLEVEGEFDLGRLNKSWQQLIERHDMLRAVMLPSGQQQVQLEVPPYEIGEVDLRGEDEATTAAALQKLRAKISHQVLPSDQWPLFTITAARLNDGRVRLHIGLDALVIDGWSIAILFKEWGALYRDAATVLPPLEITFRDYVLAENTLKESKKYQIDAEYWRQRLADLPPAPELPLAKSPQEVTEGRFVRRSEALSVEEWAQLKQRGNRLGLTPTGVLLAAYAYVVAVWSQNQHFTLNIPQFNRFPMHPQVNSIVGEAASFSLLEVNIAASDHFEAHARKVQQQLWSDLDHNYFGGVQVLRELSQQSERSGGALMPVIFTGSPQDPDGNDGYATNAARELGEVTFAINQTPQVWLDNHISEQQGRLVCDWDTVDELFPPGLPEDMLCAYFELLRKLIRDEHSWQQPWPALATKIVPAHQLRRRAEVNGKTAAIPDLLLQDLLAVHSQAGMDAPAVITSQRTLSHGELQRLSHQWGHHLRTLGVKPGTLVAVAMEKGWEQAVAAYGILQAGAAYVPLDTNQPQERLWALLNNSQASYVLTQSWLDQQLEWPAGVQRLCVDQVDVSGFSSEVPEPVQTPDDIAYIIYTSGSTGMPKGVMISHRGAVNAIECTNSAFEVTSSDRMLAVTALHHDMSVYDLFGVLAAGGAIIMPDPQGRRDPAHWVELMQQYPVTLWNSVPAMMDMLLEYADGQPGKIPDTLRYAFLGGDWIPVTIPERLAQHVPAAQVVSVGGPTETTLWNIWYPVKEIDPTWKSIPYGQPIANTQYHILNAMLTPCPDWVPGEMCCAGVGVARGYLNDDQRTAEKFITHPQTGERLYRTGDVGRYLPDGNIEFVGRTDFQIKIQGQRIETGEIESALLKHEHLNAAVVTAVGKGSARKRLVAYVVSTSGSAQSSQALRDFLGEKLPEYMIPTRFVFLERLPLTANGKVDRKSLPAPEEIKPDTAKADESSDSSIKTRLKALVEEVLEIKALDPEANLIAMGANSIDMVKIGNQVEKAFGFRPRMDEIFRLQNVNAIAEYCGQHTEDDESESKRASATEVKTGVKAVIATFPPIRDPAEREAFKNSQPAIRRQDDNKSFVQLEKPEDNEALRQKYARRFSHRRFGFQRVPFAQFSRFLSCLYQITLNGKPKYLYASPGGLYSTQTYIHVKPGRIEGVPAGAYYYHPVEHRLVTLTPDVEIDRGIHVPYVNTPVFDEAAFSIFLVTDLAAVAPSYGELATYFGKLEAGVMAHLIEQSAHDCELAICQVGGANFDKIRDYFDINENYYFIHSLMGGPFYKSDDPKMDPNVVISEEPLARVKSLVDHIKQLSPQEVLHLLEQHQLIDNAGKPE